ncbi:hypothetical protein OJ996_11145 [Luteolibacter sp. GHJ8]|uniref:DUF4034 domain-containing protein n=1 Tax=Luteolibacter rhizosphaerae TaxID=2989719 RepID=A0ABT3G4K2_9BACT|nr:hypothetical protein [Luteolibacter rhizosphaerae]MCW1914135.1 hypothetical protein [Luteolibacter rhizosphaerae]
MPRIKTLLKGGLMIALLGLLAYGGKKAGQQIARSGIIARPVPKAKATAGADTSTPSRTTSEPAREGVAASALKRLEALASGSPNYTIDWEAQMQMDAIIAKLNAAELAEVFAGLKAGPTLYILGEKVGVAWMAKDPDAALRAALVKTPDGRGSFAHRIFAAWSADEPRAAIEWLNTATLPEKPADLAESLRGGAVIGLVERDFELATTEFLKMKENKMGDHGFRDPMGVWGHLYADDPAMRERLVAFAKTTGRPEDYAALNQSLLKQWPQEDAMGMMTYMYELRDYLESGAVAGEKSPQVDGTAVAAAIYREYDRPALEWWMERYADSRETSAPMRDAMSGWTNKYPEKVLQWFEEQPPSAQRDALASATIPTLGRNGKFEEAARAVEMIQDPANRQAAAERLEIFWKDKDAAAAAAWRAGLNQQ